jgi:segregation and condensation protein A
LSGVFLKLDQFEGPLDLLLHLIKVNEIDIFNIDLLLLSNQYLQYLRLMEFSDLTDAGDFVEMAASLIEIKSSMLLPREDKPENEEDESEDPARDLRLRLLEYETIQRAGEFFQAMPQLGVEIQTNHEWQRLLPVYEDLEAPLTGEPASLIVLYEQILRDFAERKPGAKVTAVTHRVGLQEVMAKLKGLLDTVKFTLFQAFYKDFDSRYDLVVHVLAILEMSRWGEAKLYQEGSEGPLWVYKPDFDENQLPVNRLKDLEQPKEITQDA